VQEELIFVDEPIVRSTARIDECVSHANGKPAREVIVRTSVNVRADISADGEAADIGVEIDAPTARWVEDGLEADQRFAPKQRSDGTVEGFHCQGWTFEAETGSTGEWGELTETNSSWTSSGSVVCANEYRLYCFFSP